MSANKHSAATAWERCTGQPRRAVRAQLSDEGGRGSHEPDAEAAAAAAASARPPRTHAITAVACGSSRSELKITGRPCLTTAASRSITSRLAPTSGARSVLLITSRSDVVTPGPPLRGTLSPPDTSSTKICRSARPRLKRRGQVVAAALDQDQIQRVELRFQVLHRVEVGGDVVADGGVRAAAGLHGQDAARVQHPGPAQEVGVLGRVDVVGHHREPYPLAEAPA